VTMAYAALARRLTESGVIPDPWTDGRPRFRAHPLLLGAGEAEELAQAGEDVGRLWDEACRLCAADPALLDDFLGLSPVQKLMWSATAPAWHGIARADLFRLADGRLATTELNCDTPSGQPEAVVLGRIFAEAGLFDLNAQLEARLIALVDELAGRRPLAIGIVYPTELTEDLGMIALYRRWFEARGHRVVLGSPYNLAPLPRGRVALFGTACDVIVRHYKTDWWGERETVWSDAAPFPDAAPLDGPLDAILDAVVEGGCQVINPFGAVVPQNKRIMALMWEQTARFSAWGQAAIQRLVPETRRLETLDPATLDRQHWVLKSDYGCESDEVILGTRVTADVWAASLERAVPGRWVAQRRFDAVGDEPGGIINHGVYLVAGRVSGLYCRVEPIDASGVVQSVAAMVKT
jgi:hypothetical protein